MGVEVGTQRLWERAEELGLARLIFVNMLDRERADFFRTLESLKSSFGPHAVATEIPIGSEHEVRGVIDLVDMKAYEFSGDGKDNCKEIPIPDELQAQAEEYREKLLDEVAENSDDLMERYLEGEEISHDETVTALKTGVTAGRLFPVTCGVATHNLAVNRLLDAIVEDLPSPAKKGPVEAGAATLEPREDADTVAFVFKTLADPYAGRINLFRVYQGVVKADSHAAQPARRRQGAHRASCSCRRARRPGTRTSSAPATSARWPSSRRPTRATCSPSGPMDDHAVAAGVPGAGDGVRDRAQGEGRRGEGRPGAAPPPGGGPDDRLPPRLADRRADRGRPVADPRRGDRRADEGALRRRGQPEAAARAVPGDDQGQGAVTRPLQEADRRARPVRRLPHPHRAAAGRRGLRVREPDQGRRDPAPASSRRSRRASSRRCRTAWWRATR